MRSLDWFIRRVGSRIYRDDSGCPCKHCKEVVISGLVIADNAHASYLFDTQNDYAAEGTKLNYRDKKENEVHNY